MAREDYSGSRVTGVHIFMGWRSYCFKTIYGDGTPTQKICTTLDLPIVATVLGADGTADPIFALLPFGDDAMRRWGSATVLAFFSATVFATVSLAVFALLYCNVRVFGSGPYLQIFRFGAFLNGATLAVVLLGFYAAASGHFAAAYDGSAAAKPLGLFPQYAWVLSTLSAVVFLSWAVALLGGIGTAIDGQIAGKLIEANVVGDVRAARRCAASRWRSLAAPPRTTSAPSTPLSAALVEVVPVSAAAAAAPPLSTALEPPPGSALV